MKKKIYIGIALFILAITTVGATYAFFTAMTSITNAVNSSSYDFNIVYTGGTTLSGNLKVLSARDNAPNTTVHIRLGSESIVASANLYINIEEISSAIATNGFKWEVEGIKDDTVVYTNSGNFSGKVANDKITIVSNYELDYVNTDFTVYLWLDENIVGNEVVGTTFSGFISADTNDFTGSLTPVSFATDSWATIQYAVQTGNTSAYSVGDTREITLTGFTNGETGSDGKYTIRIANKSTPSECSTSGFSQTACGFVIEFVDIITKQPMNSTDTNVGGWPETTMRTYVNEDIYEALPSELQSIIINTTVVSGHGSTSGETNFTSTDKLYLLSAHEVWEDGSSNKVSTYDTAYNNTRQLDYYNGQGVTTDNYDGAIHNYNGSATWFWLRGASSYNTYDFLGVAGNGDWNYNIAYLTNGVLPAFRIG